MKRILSVSAAVILFAAGFLSCDRKGGCGTIVYPDTDNITGRYAVAYNCTIDGKQANGTDPKGTLSIGGNGNDNIKTGIVFHHDITENGDPRELRVELISSGETGLKEKGSQAIDWEGKGTLRISGITYENMPVTIKGEIKKRTKTKSTRCSPAPWPGPGVYYELSAVITASAYIIDGVGPSTIIVEVETGDEEQYH